MKKTRRHITLFVLLILLFSFALPCVPALADARSGSLTDTVSWELSDDGVLRISGKGDMPDYNFLSSFGEVISPPWSPFASEIKEILIGEGITRIGSYSFCYYVTTTETAEYSSLQKIVFPSTLQSVGSDAFFCHYYNFDIQPTLHVPSLKDWCEIRFETDGVCDDVGSNQYASPVWTAGTPYIDGKQPSGTVVFPKSLTEVQPCTFDGWSGITEIVLHDGITEIGELAFSSRDLQKINLPDGITEIKMGTFSNCASLTEIELPDSVSSIGALGFSNCQALKEIKLPTSLRYLGTDAFESCDALTAIHITDLSSYLRIVFAEPFESGHLLQGGKDTPRTLYLNGETITELVIPFEISSIPSYAFYGCDTLTKVTFENQFEQIGKGAFANCTALESVEYVLNSQTVRNASGDIIQDLAFSGCTSLQQIPSVYQYIGARAFENCTALTDLDLHANYVAPDAFEGCTSLKSATLSSNVLNDITDETHSLFTVPEIKLPYAEPTEALLEYYTKVSGDGETAVYTRCEHEWEQGDVPRATADGCAFDSKCTLCNKEKTDIQSHKLGDLVVVTEPTQETQGKEELACTVCGEVIYTRTVDKLPPSEESAAESSAPSESDASSQAVEPNGDRGVAVWVTVLVALLAAACGAGAVFLILRRKA